ncbi:MAG: dockerin type I domain-containing protein, partial [Planctomycetota bacterium]
SISASESTSMLNSGKSSSKMLNVIELTVSITSDLPGVLDVPATVVFPAGRTFVDFEIATVDNDVVNGTRQVDLTVDGEGHPAITQPVTVTDDELPGFEFTEESVSLTEGEAARSVGLRLLAQPDADVIVSFATSDPNQAVVTPTELVFTPDNWELAQDVAVEPLDDVTVEPIRMLELVASVVSEGPYSVLEDLALPMELSDDDVAMILLEETDDSTIVDELGATDTFLLSLGARPATDVTLSIDGSQVPNAVFSVTSVVFTPDNWDVPQSVSVSTPLDFDDEGNSIGPVYIDVDAENSDPEYAAAGRRTLAVVEVDSILRNVVVRRDVNELQVINATNDQVLRSTSLDDVGGNVVSTGSRSERVTVGPLGSDREIFVETAAGDDDIELVAMTGGLIDGGLGYDTASFLAAGELLMEDAGGVKLRNIEEIDLTNAGVQRLVLDEQKLRDITDENNTLFVVIGEGDEIVLNDGFEFGAPIVVAGIPSHTLTKDDATIQISNGTLWQNPFDLFDVDRSGDVSVRDALVTINRLARQGDSELPLLPENADEFFYDVNGDGSSTPSDALAVINRLAVIGSSEGEQVNAGPASWQDSVDQVAQSYVSDWNARRQDDEQDFENGSHLF